MDAEHGERVWVSDEAMALAALPLDARCSTWPFFTRALAVAAGPIQAIAALASALPQCSAARLGWLELERTRAVLQPCARAMPSLQSGLRCYRAFRVKVLLHPRATLPPAAEALAAWLHAEAARLGPRSGLVAGDLIDLLPVALAAIR